MKRPEPPSFVETPSLSVAPGHCPAPDGALPPLGLKQLGGGCLPPPGGWGLLWALGAQCWCWHPRSRARWESLTELGCPVPGGFGKQARTRCWAIPSHRPASASWFPTCERWIEVSFSPKGPAGPLAWFAGQGAGGRGRGRHGTGGSTSEWSRVVWPVGLRPYGPSCALEATQESPEWKLSANPKGSPALRDVIYVAPPWLQTTVFFLGPRGLTSSPREGWGSSSDPRLIP